MSIKNYVAAVSETQLPRSKRNENPQNISKPKQIVPKGCKEYFFNTLGEFLNHNDGVYCFKCIAINDKSAITKFKKWREKIYFSK